ncbi:hypothetical protein D3C71_1523730 [compost metagenome]
MAPFTQPGRRHFQPEVRQVLLCIGAVKLLLMDRLGFIPVPDQLDAIKCAWTRGVITPQLELDTQWIQPGIFGQKIVFPTLDRRQYTDYNERSEAGIGFINRSRVLRHVYSLTEQRAGRTTEKHLSGEWLENKPMFIHGSSETTAITATREEEPSHPLLVASPITSDSVRPHWRPTAARSCHRGYSQIQHAVKPCPSTSG